MRELDRDGPRADSGADQDYPAARDQREDPNYSEHLHRVSHPAGRDQHEAQPRGGECPAPGGGGGLHQHPGKRQGGLPVQEPGVPQEAEQEQESGPG